jgi:hypothetical protein
VQLVAVVTEVVWGLSWEAIAAAVPIVVGLAIALLRWFDAHEILERWRERGNDDRRR